MTRVLLVDDDPDIRTVARMALELVGGFRVVLAASASEAIAAASQDAFDVVLLDVMMPGGSGPAALGPIRERTRAPVLFLTARVQPGDVGEYRAAGAAGVIAKPFDPMTLAAQVERFLAAGEQPRTP